MNEQSNFDSPCESEKFPDLEEIRTECDRARLAINAMSLKQRDEMHRGALKLIFPNGYWECACEGRKGRAGALYQVAKGKSCQVCRKGEGETSTQYVCGFMFSPDLSRVALIRKTKPKWQAGKLNGIGGKVEESDATALDAQLREFREETGCVTRPEDWQHFAWMGDGSQDSCCNTWEIDFFTARGDVNALKTTTEEEIEVFGTRSIFIGRTDMVENLPFLISLAHLKLATGRPSFSTIQYLD